MALSAIVVKYHRLIVVIFSSLAIVLGYFAFAKFSVDSNLASLAPKGENFYTEQLDFLKEKMSSNVLVVVTYANGDVEKTLKILAELKEAFESSGYIQETMKVDDPEIFIKYGFLTVEASNFDKIFSTFDPSLGNFLDFEEWRKIVASSASAYNLISDYARRSDIEKYVLISPDKEIALINFVLKDDFTNISVMNKVVAELKKIASNLEKQWSTKFLFTGTPAGVYESNQQVKKDFALTTMISLGGICAIILAGFGSFAVLVLLFISMIVAMLITLGFVNLVLGEINIVTSFVNAMLLGLGIDYGIYVISRIAFFSSEKRVDESSVSAALNELAKPSIVALLTTIGAFGSMFLGLSKPFVQMAIFAIFGMVSFYLTMMLFLPALILTLKVQFKETRRKLLGNFIFNNKLRRIFKISMLIALIIFIPLGIQNLSNYWYTPSGLVSDKAESAIAFNKVKQSFQKVGLGEICLLADNLEDLKRLEGIVKNSGFLVEPLSVLNILELASNKTLEDLPEVYRQVFQIVNNPFLSAIFHRVGIYPQLLEMLRFVRSTNNLEDIVMELKKDVPMVFYEQNGKSYFVLYTDGIENIYQANRLKNVFNYFEQNNVKVYGYPALLYEVMKEMKKTIYFLGILVFLGVFAAVLLTLRSLRKALFITTLLLLSIITTFGIGKILGFHTTFLTLLIFPVLTGIGVDGFVHATFAIERKEKNLISKTLHSISLSSFTTTAAFGSFTLAQGKLLSEFGSLMAIGFFVNYLLVIYLTSFYKGGGNDENRHDD
ncbi:efflux RND transporter permease subunit [Pseudothermotoga thermarum]|uniref:Exporter of the RND superfamily protein-like protein n=1 Tax=Pseudothermotoga thermarum DSM 5069 TaxID=688269 RepID=F7YYE8_9THEM|nr:MMPL family transporter [Pseudothermotoga thermarum]AEH50972.1 exporter of the RND superfamily protein-like protein [Pseudothermotoga thermarum DSM 5069]